MTAEELKKRTNDFAHRCVRLTVSLPKTKLAYHIQGQLIKCSTSVVANYRPTIISQSKKSFIAKNSIVTEEVDEAAFWLEFIIDEELIKKEKVLGYLEKRKNSRLFSSHHEKQRAKA